MRLTKMGHACVRLEKDGATLVLDPGGLTEAEAVQGADAVLITHEHFDHLDEGRLHAAVEANPALCIWANADVAGKLGSLGDRVQAVGEGDGFTAAGFEVGVYGRHHAVIHPDIPIVANIGFLVDGQVFHPGDAFTVPDRTVDTVLVPTNGPWMKVSEMIDYVAELRPRRAYSVHDGLLNDTGLGLVDNFLALAGGKAGADCRRLKPGESVDLG
jgi:L-ascorbate metabolism protein UlaG (beta-lactamase superfamily)